MKDYKKLLGFTDEWFALGLVTEESLRQSAATYEASDDKNAEHYRYGAFRWYLQEHRPLPPTVAEALYKLAASDTNGPEAGAIMIDIISLPECPSSVLDRAEASGVQFLVRAARKRALRSAVETNPLTPELFKRCLESADSSLQRTLLEGKNLSTDQLQRLAEAGASCAVRNIAAGKLKASSVRADSLRD